MIEDFNQYFSLAAEYCKKCADFCEQNRVYKNNSNTTHALDSLGKIENSDIARNAENICKLCDYKSPGIVTLLKIERIKI